MPRESVRDKKAKQLKLTQLKQEAKNTITTGVHEHGMSGIKQAGKGTY